jgi:hypothetical protein
MLLLPAIAYADDPPTSGPIPDAKVAKVAPEAAPAQPPARNPDDCEVILESRHIESLVFSYQGERKTVAVSGPSVFLPPGQYMLQEIHFQGGLTIQPSFAFSLANKVPFTLDFGASATPKVTVKREGRLLRLDYQLLDAKGRNCAGAYRNHPPEFAVYQGDEKIGSGKFAYG